jgi:hypothetical protein
VADRAPGDGYIADRRLLGQMIGLEISAGRPQVVAESGHCTEVTADEFVAFQVDGGLPGRLAQLSQPDPATEAGDGFDMIRAQIPAGLSVMLDTTTIRNAVGALEERAPSPLALLDLATLSTAITCFDNVLVQPFGTHIAQAADLGIQVLDCPRDFIAGPLWSICAIASNQLRENEARRDSIEAAWAQFLGWPRHEARLGLYSWNRHQNSPYYWDGIVASYYTESLFDLQGSDSAREFLDIQTMRTLVNHELASRLGVPYLAAGLRSPVQSLAIRENHERQLIIDRLIQALAPRPARMPSAESEPYSLEYTAPFILALALEQMSTPADYWPVIARYRSRFSSLRQRLRKDRESWDGRTAPYARQMLQSLKTAAELAGQGEQATVDVSATLVAGALGGVAGASASLGLKLISLVKPADHLTRCYNRWFRPELYLLTSVRDEAANLRALDHRVQHIWKCTWLPSDYRQLDMLLAANPAPFLRFGELR